MEPPGRNYTHGVAASIGQRVATRRVAPESDPRFIYHNVSNITLPANPADDPQSEVALESYVLENEHLVSTTSSGLRSFTSTDGHSLPRLSPEEPGQSQVPVLRRQNATLGEPQHLRPTDSVSSLYPSPASPGSPENLQTPLFAANASATARAASDGRQLVALSFGSRPGVPSSSTPLPTSTNPTEVQTPRKARLILHTSRPATLRSDPDLETNITNWLEAHPESLDDYVDVESPSSRKPRITLVGSTQTDPRETETVRSRVILDAIEEVRRVEDLLEAGFLPGSKYPPYSRDEGH